LTIDVNWNLGMLTHGTAVTRTVKETEVHSIVDEYQHMHFFTFNTVLV